MVNSMRTMTTMSLPEVLEGLVQKHGSINAAARACRMAEPTFWLLYTGKRKKPTLDTLRMIAGGMDIPLHELVRRIEDGGRKVRAASH